MRRRSHIIEVARQAGHSPTMTLDTYGHVFDEASGIDGASAEDAIVSARLGLREAPAADGARAVDAFQSVGTFAS